VTGQRRGFIWIASYPKSGNTWVRFLVCNLVFGVQDSAAELNRLAPDIHELGAVPALPEQPVLMKTHFPSTAALALGAETAGAIYVVRNPGDVMLSNYHYSRRRGDETAHEAAAFERYVGQFLAARGDPRWIALHMGTWDDHVRGWLQVRHAFPVLPLRYEDLLADPQRGAAQICSFLGLTRSDEALALAVRGASFQRMREIEEADIRARKVGIFYKPYLQPSIDAGLRFMRAGQSGEGSRALSAPLRARLAGTFGPLMQELGYAAPAPAGRGAVV